MAKVHIVTHHIDVNELPDVLLLVIRRRLSCSKCQANVGKLFINALLLLLSSLAYIVLGGGRRRRRKEGSFKVRITEKIKVENGVTMMTHSYGYQR